MGKVLGNRFELLRWANLGLGCALAPAGRVLAGAIGVFDIRQHTCSLAP